jgi:undecaprenyl diphosphate synthase
MDGNGRWASKRFLPRLAGHRAGAASVRTAITYCRKKGIRYLTLYAFSTENWKRPADEVQGLMGLFVEHLASETDSLAKNNVRLRVIGDLQALLPAVKEKLEESLQKTRHCDGLDLILALSYGGRLEIVQAVQTIARRVQQGNLSPEGINEEVIAESLYASDVPDPDLMIRTSGEMRLSNFLLWQLAYAEIVVTPTLWPDFNEEEFERCIREFAGRERRFGKTSQQLVKG